jgi:flagellar assembly protein FliH
MSTSSSARRKTAADEASAFPYSELNHQLFRQDNASQTLEEEMKKREATAREEGRLEAEAQALATTETRLEEIRTGITEALEQFARERHDYYVRAERELVQLALCIARKVLQRESTIDPLLLAGMVRVLLERMEQSTTIKVYVHPAQVSEFRAFFARHMGEQQPEIVADGLLSEGRCTVHTEFGTTEVGPELQLKEIERGLLDLQAAKPASR